MIKLFSFFLFFIILLNKVESQTIYSIQNFSDQLNIYITEINSSISKKIFVNDYEITSFCDFQEDGAIDLYNCKGLPAIDQIMSGSINVIINGNLISKEFDFSPITEEILYIDQSTFSLPTTGGVVSLKGRYYSAKRFDGSSNNIQVVYRTVSLSPNLFTINNSTSITVQIPDGTGTSNGGNNNQIYVRASVNSTSINSINYASPIINKVSYDESNSYITVDGENFGAYSNLITIYACGRVINGNNIQLIVPHYQIMVYYDKLAFNSLTCQNFQVGVNGQNSPSVNLHIPSHITSVSTPPALGGKITIRGSFLSNINYDGSSLPVWRVYMNGVAFQSSSCPFISSSYIICNSPARSSNTELSVYLEINLNGYVTETIDAPYVIQKIYAVSKTLYGQAAQVTITGESFSNDGPISVTIGGEGCLDPQFIDSTSIQCEFGGNTAPNPNGLTVTVSTNNGVTSENIFYYFNEQFALISQTGDTLNLFGNSFTSAITSIKVGSYEIFGYCSIISPSMISCTKVPDIPSGVVTITGSAVYSLPFTFTPYIMSISKNSFSTDGGEVIQITGKYFESKVNSQGEQTLFVLINSNGVIKQFSSFQLISSTEIQFVIPFGTGTGHLLTVKQLYLESNSASFSYLAPNIDGFAQNSALVTIYGSNFGEDLSMITISIGSNTLNNKRIISPNTALAVFIPWDQQNGQLIIKVNGQQDSTLFKLLPELISIDSPPVTGGTVNVVGTFMNNQNSDGSLNINLITKVNDVTTSTPPCTLIESPATFSNNIFKYSCQIIAGSGNFSAYTIIDTVSSNSIIQSYQAPSVISSSFTIYGIPSTVSIYGNNFAQPVTIHIQDSNGNNQECTDPIVLSPTNLTCQFASTIPKPSINMDQYFDVIVNVNGLISNNNKVFKYFEVVSIDSIIQNLNSITIIGSGFSDDIDSTKVYISTQFLDICKVNNDTTIICLFIPSNTVSGNIVVSNKYTKSNSFQYYLKPFIYGLDTQNLDTAGGQTVTLTGGFFEAIDPITNQDNDFKLLLDGITALTIIQMDSSTIIFKTIPGFGKKHYVIVSQNRGTMFSNQVQYLYSPPIISNLIQINENQFSIDAQYFSSDDLTLNSIQINDQKSTIRPTISSDSKSLIFSVDGKSSNGQISLIVDELVSNYLSIHFTPIIKSISSKPYLDGSSIVTVTGLYFSNLNYQTGKQVNLSFSYILNSDIKSGDKNLECNYIDSESVSCKGFNGYGDAELKLIKTDDSIQYISNSFQFSFQSPIVIKSTSLYYQEPGNITITAQSFSESSENLEIYIEDKTSCTNPIVLDNRHIQCYYDASVPPKQDQSSLKISIISNNMTGDNQVFYYYEILNCPNNCTSESQGQCNIKNGQCLCNNNWEGIDCSINQQKPLPPPIIDNNGNSTFSGGNNINFTVSIAYLREININGNPVKTFDMNLIDWLIRTQISNTSTYYKGTFKDETLIVELSTTFYNDSSEYDFAGDIISIPKNSVKYVITISNYSFNSTFNTFQVIYNSKAKLYYDDGCNIIETTSSSGKALNTTESISWFQLEAGNSVLDAKFSRRMFIDDKVRKSDISILSLDDPLYLLLNSSKNNNTIQDKNQNYYNRLVSINSSYFKNSIQLDPSFNSLIRTSSKDSCESNKWKIPVIASLCTVGGVAIIAGLIGLFYSRYKKRQLKTQINIRLRNLN